MIKAEHVAWDEACFDCAVKRGWGEEISKSRGPESFPFVCVHRQDLKGSLRVCAGAKKALQEFEEEVRKADIKRKIFQQLILSRK